MNYSIFDLEHIFVVFQPGSGGNFIAELLTKLYNNQLDAVAVSNTGSSHNLINRKLTGTDYLSFGTEVVEQLKFASAEERLEFYLNNIKETYGTSTTPQVVWSHDFTNIPVYKKYFPNSKILVITQESDDEKLTVMIMQILKTLLDQTVVLPVDDVRWNRVQRGWKHWCNEEISKIVGKPAPEIFEDKFNEKNINLVKYATFNMLLLYFGLRHVVDNTLPRMPDLANHVLYPKDKIELPPYIIGKPYSDYITDDCVLLPYRYLTENNIDMLIQSLALLLPHELSILQVEFIKNNFKSYRDKQDQLLLTNPKEYYLATKRLALANI